MKNNRVRFVCLVLACVMFLTMAAASSSENSDSQKPLSGSSSGNTSENNSGEESSAETVQDITIEEQVLFDRDGIVVTAKEFSHDSIWGDSIKLLVENNRDENVTVSCRNLIVNHYMVSNLFSCEVAAGKKVNKELSLPSSDLKKAGISTVSEVEASFNVYNSDNWDDIFNTDLICIQTSAYGQVEYKAEESGKELFNNGEIRIVGKYVDEDDFWGAAIQLFIENNSAQTIVVHARDFSVNGYMLTPLFSSTVFSGRMAIDDITLFSSEMEENGIESIEEVELTFHITDESYFNTIADSEPITFTID